jgi:glutaminyl-peptide cyclotransferase
MADTRKPAPQPASPLLLPPGRRWLVGGASALLVAAIAGLFMLKTWSNGAEHAGEPFASDRAKSGGFDGKRALGYLEDVCAIGPRISGTDGMKKQQELIEKHFEKCGAKVDYQRFSARQRSQRDPVEMANLVASWHRERERRVILCSHYDTRPIADNEPDRRKWREAFVSANDGGSGVALMMELANAMKDMKTEVGVDFVCFDGEEYVFDHEDKYFFGSEHFAATARKNKGKKYLGAVLLDMVGGEGARFPVEPRSLAQAGSLVEELWSIAVEQKCPAFRNEMGPGVEDDHVPLNRAGIKAVDIIDISYPQWHRLGDTPDKCSADSLEQVARVLTVWLKRVK